MAYTPHTWECGETITAELLNNIEGGVQEALGGSTSAPLIVTVDRQIVQCEGEEDATKQIYTYDHSWQEIHDALLAKRPAYMAYNETVAGNVAVYLNPIVYAGQSTVDGYVVAAAAGMFPFSDANSLVYETECGGK